MQPAKIFQTCCLIVVVLLASCTPDNQHSLPEKTLGYKPIYANNLSDYKEVYTMPARPTTKAGKIYVQGNLLFQVEQDSGIHVINIADRSNPVKLGFIRSVLCKEVAVKNGYVYTNNLADLVIVDITNIGAVKVKSRLENVFPELTLHSPPRENDMQTTYFECPDPEKGFVIGWEKTTITKPKCWK